MKDIEESEESDFSKLTSARSSVTSSVLLEDEDIGCATKDGFSFSVCSGSEGGKDDGDDVDTDTDDDGRMSGI